MKQHMQNTINKQIPITWLLMVILGAIIWGLRLEAQVKANENHIENITENVNIIVDNTEDIKDTIYEVKLEQTKIKKDVEFIKAAIENGN